MERNFRKTGKKAVQFFLALVMMFSLCMPVRADGLGADGIGEKVDGSVLTNEQSAEAVETSLLRGNILLKGVARISNNEDGTVNVYGAVLGNTVCDKLILEMTLQRYVNGSWVNVKSFSSSSTNASMLTKSYNVSVTKGYYYRMKAACVAQKGSTSESSAPVTDGIWID